MSSNDKLTTHPRTRAALAAMTEYVREQGDFRCCVNCVHFDQQPEVCSKWGARPPAKVIAFGCDNFEPDIPF